MKKEMRMKTDKQLQQDVLDELVWEPSVDAAEIGVSVENGVVILNGTVKSLTEKWTAERVTQHVEGVRAVTDELTVKLAGDSQHNDPDIAQAAVNALDWNASVPRNRIKVLVENGWVTLDGSVEYHFQKDAAEGAIRNLKGVKGVSNMIAINPRVSAGMSYTRLRRRFIEPHRWTQRRFPWKRVPVRLSSVEMFELGQNERKPSGGLAAPGVTNVQNDIRIVSAVGAQSATAR